MSEYDINKRMVETLIKAGAFDNLGIYRSQLLNSYESLINVLSEKNRNNISGQLDMFSMVQPSGGASFDKPKFEYPNIAEFSLKELLALERESSGMYFSGHPIESYDKHANFLGLNNLSLLHNESELTEKHVKVAVMVSSVTVKTTKNNEKMAFVLVEDRFGEIECIVFANKYTRFMHNLRIDAPLAIEGTLSIRDDESPRIIVSNIEELVENSRFVSPETKDAPASNKKEESISPKNERPISPQKIYLKVPDMECQKYLKALNLVDIFAGTTQVIFYNADTKKYISYSNGISLSKVVLSELYNILGEDNVVLK